MSTTLDWADHELPPDLHEQARTVAAHTRTAQDAFEVAVILATCGYTDQRAQELGSADVFALAKRIYPLLPLFTGPVEELPVGATPPRVLPPTGPDTLSTGLLARSLLYSAPWIVAIAALVISRVSFWSTITTHQISSAISLGLFVALIVTGAFIQAFARRGIFYALQGNRELLDWALRRTLALGAGVLVIVIGGGYLLLERVVHAYTPAATRSFAYFGVSIGFMLLAFAPLYLARAFWSILAAAGAGGAVAIVGGLRITHGQYINPYTAQHVQLLALGTAIVAAVVLDTFALRRLVRTGPDPQEVRGSVRAPRLAPVARSVAPYAAYGAGFFALIIVDQLVAGGLWHGTFNYDGRYELAVGVGLLILIPTLTYGVAASELFPATVQRELRQHRVNDAADLRRVLSAFYLRHLVVTVLVGISFGLVLFGLGFFFATTTSVTAGLDNVYGVYGAALLAYLFIAIAAFNSGMLFSLAAPTTPAIVTWVATGISCATGVVLARVWNPEDGALLGLLCGATIFAVATTVATQRAFDRFDISYYQAF